MTGHEGRLQGEFALVTGSTAGIGREIALLFGSEGATVAVTGRDLERGQAVVAGIEAAGGHALFLPADLTDKAETDSLVDRVVEEMGEVTILVNNATGVGGPGGDRDAAVHDLDAEHWERILRVDLTAAMVLCQAAIGAMLDAEHGAIVNISSRAAVRGTPGHAAYTAAKGGLNALTRSIAVDYASQGIRANSISPGYILNDRRDRELSDERRAQLEAMHLTRLGLPGDVARAALFLAEPASGFITGIDLPVDGGSTIARAGSLG